MTEDEYAFVRAQEDKYYRIALIMLKIERDYDKYLKGWWRF